MSSADRPETVRKTVASRVLLFVLVAGLIRLLLMGGVTVDASRELFGQLMHPVLGSAAERGARGVDKLLAASKAQVGRLANTNPLRGMIAVHPHGRASQRLASLLEEERVRGALFDGLLALDRSGRVLAETGATAALRDANHEALARTTATQLSTLAAKDGGGWLVASAPVPDRSGRPVASLHGVIGAVGLLPKLPHTGTLLIAADGSVLLSEPLPVSAARRHFSLGPIAPSASPRVETYEDADGDEHLLAAVALESVDWTLVLHAHRGAMAWIARPLLLRMLPIDLFGLMLVAGLAYLIADGYMRRLDALSKGAERIAQGELDLQVRDDPGQDDEIGRLTHTFNLMTAKLHHDQHEIATAQRRLVAKNEEMRRVNEVLAQLSITDGLTKLHNHRFFQDHLTREIKRVERTDEPLCMLLADIDDFKQLNDRLGHAAGDELLVRIAQIMSASVRESDLLARYGGEEFAIVTTGTDLEGAVKLAEKIRTAIAETPFILDESMRLRRVTVSIGVAQYRNDRKAFFGEADQALYRAKAEGKNCVLQADAPA